MPLTTVLNEGDVLSIRVEVTDSLGNVQYFPGAGGDETVVTNGIEVVTTSSSSFYRATDVHVNKVSSMSFNRATNAHVGTVSATAFFKVTP